jgi:hypothetical protein
MKSVILGLDGTSSKETSLQFVTIIFLPSIVLLVLRGVAL